MFVLKGFATNSKFADNSVGVVNEIGELSPYSRTYSREVGLYVNDLSKDIILHSFICKNDEVNVSLNPDVRDNILEIVKFVYDYTLKNTGQIFADQLLRELYVKFAAKADQFSSGVIVSDGNFYAPEWLSWKFKGLGDNYIKIWFSDDSFKHKYDEYEIVVVPPIDRLDDFFRRSQEVERIVNERDMSELMQKVQDAKKDHPETIIRTEIYEYRDPIDQVKRIKTSWTLLIYGAAGNNIDSIKDALVDHILSNSEQSRENWATIFPDIFKRTEFILVPFWDMMAIPNRVTEAGIYSPFTQLTYAIATISAYAPEYPDVHKISYGTIMAHAYKSLNIGVISSDENRDGIFNITQVVPDYIATSTLSQDFNRMSETTREWALAIAEMIILAEDMNQYSDMPKGYTKVMRGDLLYVVKNFNNIHFLVTAKKNFFVEEEDESNPV